MNGWLIEDEDEPLEHEASDKEVDSDLDSTASSKPNGPYNNNNNEENPDIAAIIAQQLQTVLPQIVIQVTNNVNNSNGVNGGNNGCTYKGFMACNPKEYDGKGVQARSREAAIGVSWTNFKAFLVEELCPSNEMEKLKSEFWNHKMVAANHAGYTDRFHELSETDQVGNRLTIKGNQNLRNNGNQVIGRALNVNAVGALQDPNIVTEVVDGKKVEVDRVIYDCKLELGTSLFTIDLIPLGLGSFDVIVGMDWLSEHKAEIVYHEKVVRIPLKNGEILHVQGERTSGIAKALSNVKVDEPKLSDISVVRDFVEVFPKDLSRLLPQRQVEFRIDLVSGATPVAKSPYRLAPSKMQELSEQLQELKDKVYSKSKDGHEVHLRLVLELLKKEEFKIKAVKNWKAPTTPSEIRSFLGLAEQEEAFQTLKDNLCNALILSFPDGVEDFIVYCDASNQGLGCVLMQRGKMERREDGSLYFLDRIWVPLVRGVRTIIMDEAHKTGYSVHPGADKMYLDLRDMYWWPAMKRNISTYVSKCLTCAKVKAEHQRPSGLLQQPDIPEWKWDKITMDLITKLPRSRGGYDAIWVIVDRLTKLAHFLAIRKDFSTEKLARLYINEIVAQHRVPVSIISDRDGRFTSLLAIGTKSIGDKIRLEYCLSSSDRRINYHSNIRCAPFEALYGRKYRSPVLRAEIGEGSLIGPKLVQETTDKVKVFPKELGEVHDIFHVSNLKKCLADLVSAIVRQSGPNNNNNNNEENPDIAAIIAYCTYKRFMACNPKEYDGKGGMIALTRWIEKMENVIDNSGCAENQKRVLVPRNEMKKLESEFWNHKMVGANHAGYTDRFHELAKLVPHLVTPESSCIKRYIAGLTPKIRGMLRATQPTTIQSKILRAGILTDEAVSYGTLTKGSEKRKGVEESRKHGSRRNDDKRAKTLSSVLQLSDIEFTLQGHSHFRPIKQVAPINAVRGRYEPGTCYECGSREHYQNTCPKLNLEPSQVGNRLTIEGNRNSRNNKNQVKGRAFNVNAVGALQDPNVVTGTFSLNHHYATVIEVEDGKKVEVDRVICDCKLELGTSLFTIDLIPLGHGSFDVIVGMDWLSEHKAEIVCHEKVVRIPLENGEILHFQGGRTLGIAKALSNVKVDEPKMSDISVVRDFVKVFLEDLSGLPPQRQVEFRIDLVQFLGHVVNQNGIHMDPTKIKAVKNWKAPTTPSKIRSFLGLADKLCNAPILSLPDGIEDFIVYCDASNQGLGCVLMQRGKNELKMLQMRWIELFSDYECKIRYHPGKANMVADALSRKERVKPRRIRAMAKTIQSGIRGMVLAAQDEMFKQENILVERLHGLNQQMERREDSKCLTCAKVKAEHQRPLSLLQQPEIPEWKWDKITMDLITKLPSIRYAPFEALYGRNCRSPILLAEIGEGGLIRPELVQETTNKVVLIKEKLKTARDHQKSYADNRRKLLEFEVGDKVLLKVSPWKGVMHFGKSGKLAPRYVGPFEILERIGPAAYRLRLPKELSEVHDIFHVSNLKKCLADANLHVPLDEIKVDKTIHFVEKPVEIIDREVKTLKRNKIPIVKVRCILRLVIGLHGCSFYSAKKRHMKASYPHLFVAIASESSG
ncbi:putative reverse transcriptase domain-containing protein [Tanacetum coccineum]